MSEEKIILTPELLEEMKRLVPSLRTKEDWKRREDKVRELIDKGALPAIEYDLPVKQDIKNK